MNFENLTFCKNLISDNFLQHNGLWFHENLPCEKYPLYSLESKDMMHVSYRVGNFTQSFLGDVIVCADFYIHTIPIYPTVEFFL